LFSPYVPLHTKNVFLLPKLQLPKLSKLSSGVETDTKTLEPKTRTKLSGLLTQLLGLHPTLHVLVELALSLLKGSLVPTGSDVSKLSA
jgi:hypothetical protein